MEQGRDLHDSRSTDPAHLTLKPDNAAWTSGIGRLCASCAPLLAPVRGKEDRTRSARMQAHGVHAQRVELVHDRREVWVGCSFRLDHAPAP